jgi:ribonuclease III
MSVTKKIHHLAEPISTMSEYDVSGLEQDLGYSFKKKEILTEALTHRSFFHENPDRADTYNERLEFLGDSVLGFVIVEYLYGMDSRLSESVMAKMKSYLVKESVISEVSSSLSIGKYLRLGKGEEATGGRKKKSLLADAIEAVLGAVYLDGGLTTAREVILRLFRRKIDDLVSSGEFHDFKTELQEKTQLLFGTIPEYKTIREEGAEHRKVFTVEVMIQGERYGTGSGKSKKEAETLAAKEALNKLLQE